jgi:probable F420-dependent oxidoreductase
MSTSASPRRPPSEDRVQLGAGFPRELVGSDRGAARAYLDAIAAAGVGYLSVSDHVIGADRASHPGWPGPYDLERPSTEPAVLLGYLSALTDLDLVSGIVVLPTRPAALVAKQAAEIDQLTDGRFTLGVGLGWSPVDFEAMGSDMHTRGARFEEQIEVMRRLWTEPVVTFAGRFHTITGAGINPLPIQRPIPVCIATTDAAPALRRVGRIGDGWIPAIPVGPALDAAKAIVDRAARDAGRDPAGIRLEGSVTVRPETPEAMLTELDHMLTELDAWRAAGARRVLLSTAEPGGDLDAQIAAITRAARAVRDR